MHVGFLGTGKMAIALAGWLIAAQARRWGRANLPVVAEAHDG